MHNSELKTNKKSNFMLILLVISVILTYLVLHELGHLIVAKIFGAKISDISLNLLSAHISFDRNSLTNFQNSIVDISGVFFPLLISFLTLSGSGKYSIFFIVSLLLFISSLFPLIPFFIPMENGDTLNLIRYSGMNQITVSFIFVFLFIFGLAFLFQMKIRKKIADLFHSFFAKYSSLETSKYVKQIIGIGFYIFTIIALGNFSLFNNILNDNYEKINSIELNNNLQYPFDIIRIKCSEKDTLIVQTINIIADSIKVTYKVSAEDKEHLILKGNGVNFRGDRFFNIVPNRGEICLTVDGKNIKGKIMIFKNK